MTELENADTFPRSMWNHFRNFGPRTTNHLEAWHKGVNGILRKMHVNIFKMIKFLQQQEALNRAAMSQLRKGQAPRKKCVKYERINGNLERLVDKLEGNLIDLREYAHSVGHNS